MKWGIPTAILVGRMMIVTLYQWIHGYPADKPMYRHDTCSWTSISYVPSVHLSRRLALDIPILPGSTVRFPWKSPTIHGRFFMVELPMQIHGSLWQEKKSKKDKKEKRSQGKALPLQNAPDGQNECRRFGLNTTMLQLTIEELNKNQPIYSNQHFQWPKISS